MVSRSGSVRLAIVGILLVAVSVVAGCGNSRARYHEDDPDYWRGTLKQGPRATVTRSTSRKPAHRVSQGMAPVAAKKPQSRKPAASSRSAKRPRKVTPAFAVRPATKPAARPVAPPTEAVPPPSPYSPPVPAPQPPSQQQRTPAIAPVAPVPVQEVTASPRAPTVARSGPSVVLVPPAAAATAPARLPSPVLPTTGCDPDRPPCALVRALAADPRRSWLQRAPTRNDTLSGVRLQAMRETAASLSCTELATARDEAQAAVPALEDALAEARVAGQPVSPLSRTLLLASQLVTRLGEERLKRCS